MGHMLCVRALHNTKNHYHLIPKPSLVLTEQFHICYSFLAYRIFQTLSTFYGSPLTPCKFSMQLQNDVAKLDTVSRKGLTSLSGMEGLPHYYSYYYP